MRHVLRGRVRVLGSFCVLRAKSPGGAGIMLNWLSAKLMTTSVGDFLLAKDSFTGGLGGNGGKGDAATVQNSMNTLVKTLIGFGSIWVVACVVFAAIKLSGAQGKNPENRTQAMVGLACAAIGGFVMIKAYDIAAWVATI
ncbi:hypothetical protein BK720_07145 [Bacillus thuringiensis serovar brasilensis]|uniref:hypothetical protein n=1 Tax=Bacillus cereus group TaxID=86661 RepID=UPI000A3C2EF6|nr:hypothetical protein [Bacillus thuringiensis]MCU5032098.1 hypothetical protein [Bacillus cereus]MRA75250.1 hypothetical protein [Bacillus thuringiensis]MRA93763.1 hypothetical protein [Bacillus thuringiensis]MRC56461.1 hypothetical protein [Bacillus thuringiensis]OTX33635.1 hypothetical protein BK720_10730 [Bacillus thuringiensis serovar brasilensis]